MKISLAGQQDAVNGEVLRSPTVQAAIGYGHSAVPQLFGLPLH